jgi:hypothetical protein
VVDATPYFASNKWKWITAADLFVCAESHDDSIFPHLNRSNRSRLSQAVLGQLSWKFFEWYSNPTILSLAAGPLLAEMVQHIDSSVSDVKSKRMRMRHADRCYEATTGELRLYSGHDVSILAMHHAFASAKLPGAHTALGGWWPPYASHVIVDLVTDTDSGEFHIQICFDAADQERCGMVLPLEDFRSQIASSVTAPYLEYISASASASTPAPA